MRLWLAGPCAIVLLVSCDSPPGSPLAPNPVPVRPPAASHTLSGMVTAIGAPVVGVTVSVSWATDAATELAAATDGNGYYSIRDVRTSAPLVRVSKAGYFTDFKYVSVSRDTQLDFDLDRWVHISLGEVIQGRVGDVICTRLEGWGPKPCERFALTVPVRGTLEVTLSAPVFAFHLDVVQPDGTYLIYEGSYVSPLHGTVPVEAGLTYEIRVIGGPTAWDSPREFELTTALH